jgi:hypothetical protein
VRAGFLLLILPAVQTPGPGWVQVISGQPVFANPDSIVAIGPSTFRVVILRQETPDYRNLSTDEVNCRTGLSRTVRTRRIISGMMRSDDATPNEPWEGSYPGGPAERMYNAICALAPQKAAGQAAAPSPHVGGLPPLSTYPVGTPERALLELVHAWAKADWRRAASLQRPEWQQTHSGGGSEDYDDALRWIKAMLGWGRPITIGRFTKEQLSAGIVRLEAPLDLDHDGKTDRRMLTCKVYPISSGWGNDVDHCSMVVR